MALSCVYIDIEMLQKDPVIDVFIYFFFKARNWFARSGSHCGKSARPGHEQCCGMVSETWQ